MCIQLVCDISQLYDELGENRDLKYIFGQWNCTSNREYYCIDQIHISNPYNPLIQHVTYLLPYLTKNSLIRINNFHYKEQFYFDKGDSKQCHLESQILHASLRIALIYNQFYGVDGYSMTNQWQCNHVWWPQARIRQQYK